MPNKYKNTFLTSDYSSGGEADEEETESQESESEGDDSDDNDSNISEIDELRDGLDGPNLFGLNIGPFSLNNTGSFTNDFDKSLSGESYVPESPEHAAPPRDASIIKESDEHSESEDDDDSTVDKDWEVPKNKSDSESSSDYGKKNSSSRDTSKNTTVNSSQDSTFNESFGAGACNIKNMVVEFSDCGKRKKNFCFYCKTFQTVISRHLCLKHKNEAKVKELLSFPKGS